MSFNIWPRLTFPTHIDEDWFVRQNLEMSEFITYRDVRNTLPVCRARRRPRCPSTALCCFYRDFIWTLVKTKTTNHFHNRFMKRFERICRDLVNLKHKQTVFTLHMLCFLTHTINTNDSGRRVTETSAAKLCPLTVPRLKCRFRFHSCWSCSTITHGVQISFALDSASQATQAICPTFLMHIVGAVQTTCRHGPQLKNVFSPSAFPEKSEHLVSFFFSWSKISNRRNLLKHWHHGREQDTGQWNISCFQLCSAVQRLCFTNRCDIFIII